MGATLSKKSISSFLSNMFLSQVYTKSDLIIYGEFCMKKEFIFASSLLAFSTILKICTVCALCHTSRLVEEPMHVHQKIKLKLPQKEQRKHLPLK